MLTNTTKNSGDILEIRQTAQKLEMIKGVLGLLFMAAKNHTMYPENHAIYKESLQAVVLKNMATSDSMSRRIGSFLKMKRFTRMTPKEINWRILFFETASSG
jgi:hypothetical protein